MPPANTAIISLRCANRLVNNKMVKKTIKALTTDPKAPCPPGNLGRLINRRNQTIFSSPVIMASMFDITF